MQTLTFDQTILSRKKFHQQKKLIDNLIPENIVISDPISASINGEDQRYVIGYKDGTNIIPLYVKTPKNLHSTGVSQYNCENFSFTMGFDVEDHVEWCNTYCLLWTKMEEKMKTTFSKLPLSSSGYVNAKLKTRHKNQITTNFHQKQVPLDKACNATAILKLSSVYKQGNNYYPQVFVEECKYKNKSPHYLLSPDASDQD